MLLEIQLSAFIPKCHYPISHRSNKSRSILLYFLASFLGKQETMHQIADSMTAENVKQIPKVTFLWQTIYILSVTEANDF